MKKTIAVLALLAAPALASAQAGLSRVSYLALQQELRDQGCGVTNVDGRYGPQTRRAIATCAKKFNSANNAAALLAAMNIGFGPNDNPPSGGTGTTGSASTDMSMGAASGTTETTATTTHKKRTTKKAKAAAKAAADSTKQ